MATRRERLAEFAPDKDTQLGSKVELLCQDRDHSYVLPFTCHRTEGERRQHVDRAARTALQISGWGRSQ